MLALDHEIGFSEIALVELAGGTLTSFAELNANGFDGSTLIFDAVGSVDFSSAGQASNSLLLNAYAQLDLATTGSSVFDPEIQKLVAATLAAAGAAQVLFASEGDSDFAFVGVGTGNFIGEASVLALFNSSGVSATSFDVTAVKNIQLNAAGNSTTTAIFSAQANIDFSAAGASSSAMQLQAYGQQQFGIQGVSTFSPNIVGTNSTTLAAAGSSTTAFDVTKLIVGVFQMTGATQLGLTINAVDSANFSMVGSANGVLGGLALYDELPRAWDYVIRPYELRGIDRPYELRGVVRPYELRKVVRPSEDRTVNYS
jgi:hypothetical protein